LERGVIGDHLHFFGEGIDVAVGDDEALFAAGEEVFGSGGGGSEDGTAAGHGLALHEGEPFFNAGQHEQVAGAHLFCKFDLREGTGEDYIIGWQRGEKGPHIVLNGPGEGQAFLRVLEPGECLKQVWNAFPNAHLPCEEYLEGIRRGSFSACELVETDTVGNDVDFVGCDAHLDERSFRGCRRDGDGVSQRVDFFFADGDVRLA
jgi:hypothetical protein